MKRRAFLAATAAVAVAPALPVPQAKELTVIVGGGKDLVFYGAPIFIDTHMPPWKYYRASIPLYVVDDVE